MPSRSPYAAETWSPEQVKQLRTFSMCGCGFAYLHYLEITKLLYFKRHKRLQVWAALLQLSFDSFFGNLHSEQTVQSKQCMCGCHVCSFAYLPSLFRNYCISKGKILQVWAALLQLIFNSLGIYTVNRQTVQSKQLSQL